MRIIEMRPELTPFRAGQRRNVSSWSFHDVTEDDDGLLVDVRKIWHYNVLMMEFHGFDRVHWDDLMAGPAPTGESYRTWTARVLSKGIGSATDQQGLNQLCGARYYRNNSGEHVMLKSYHYRMLRDQKGGGPRVIYTGHPSGEHTLPL